MDKTLLSEIKSIEGWLTDNEISLLHDLAQKVSANQSIVEIGSWKGRSTVAIAKGNIKANSVPFFSIDPHTGSVEIIDAYGQVNTYGEFVANLKDHGVADHVKPLVMTSEDAAADFNDEIGLLFIDGSHLYKDVVKDLTLWKDRVVEGGYIVMHDTWHRLGPNLASLLEILKSDKVISPRAVDTITYWQVASNIGIATRLKNIIFLLYRPVINFMGFIKLQREG